MAKHRLRSSQRSSPALSWLPNVVRAGYWLVRTLLAAHGHWHDLG